MASWAIATRPQPMLLWPQKALIWEASDPYFYIRSSVDGRVICGGEDQKVATTDQRNALTECKARRIQHKLSQMFPRLDSSAEFSWTESFGISPDGMPTIGEIPRFPKCFFCHGIWRKWYYVFDAGIETNRCGHPEKTCPEAKLFAFA